MKQTKVACIVLALAMMVSSCGSAYQAESGARGAIIGGHVGEMVGLLSGHGHFRGENAAIGSLIGMGIGAILGVSVASQIEEKEKAEARRYDEDYNTISNPSPTVKSSSAVSSRKPFVVKFEIKSLNVFCSFSNFVFDIYKSLFMYNFGINPGSVFVNILFIKILIIIFCGGSSALLPCYRR